MNAQYTAEDLKRFHEKFHRVSTQVQECKLPQVRDVWESGMVNGRDTVDDLNQLRREWQMPELSAEDVERVIGLASVASLTTEREYTNRTRTWFARRGIRG
jgi:hypothetical protein